MRSCESAISARPSDSTSAAAGGAADRADAVGKVAGRRSRVSDDRRGEDGEGDRPLALAALGEVEDDERGDRGEADARHRQAGPGADRLAGDPGRALGVARGLYASGIREAISAPTSGATEANIQTMSNPASP